MEKKGITIPVANSGFASEGKNERVVTSSLTRSIFFKSYLKIFRLGFKSWNRSELTISGFSKNDHIFNIAVLFNR
ncbi:hypothetical protein JM79_0894 [Gramella sp. Hel_I_59]|nr:hypothetical protein JM79_0894 [Gramella sp. Hel_I_59]